MGGEGKERAVATQHKDAGPIGSQMLDQGVEDALQDRRGLALLQKLAPDLVKSQQPPRGEGRRGQRPVRVQSGLGSYRARLGILWGHAERLSNRRPARLAEASLSGGLPGQRRGTTRVPGRSRASPRIQADP